MGKPESSKLAQLYKSTVIRSYALEFVGFIIGVKLFDYLLLLRYSKARGGNGAHGG